MVGSAIRPAESKRPFEHSLISGMPYWEFKKSDRTISTQEFEFTHRRQVPLPLAINLTMADKTYECVYMGHGQSKVVYRFIDDEHANTVLKLTQRYDSEPDSFMHLSELVSARLPEEKICPRIRGTARCQELDACNKPTREWFGWLAEKTIPLDKYMARLSIIQQYNERMVLLKMALYKMVVAGLHGLMLSDNNLFNFGVIDSTVVIIDAGSRQITECETKKSDMNDKCIKRWWYKLRCQCKAEELAQLKTIWTSGCCLEEMAKILQQDLLSNSCIDFLSHDENVTTSDTTMTNAPDVWTMLEHADEDDEGIDIETVIEWLCSNCLQGDIAHCRLEKNGTLTQLEDSEEQMPHLRLQTIIDLTRQKRQPYDRSSDQVLEDEQVQTIISDWKTNHSAWMNETAQSDRVQSKKRKSWHHRKRDRFRTFLYQMAGCYELVIFWLYVPASWRTLRIFYSIYAEESTLSKTKRCRMAVNSVRALFAQPEYQNVCAR